MIRTPHVRTFLLILSLALCILILRYNILTVFYILYTYLTWYRFSTGVINHRDHFDTTFASYPANQSSAQTNYSNAVPAIMHHILLGDVDLNKHSTWTAAREACLKWHPNYEFKFWNESSAEQLIQNKYPWFLQTWKNYPYVIQRADSLRYIVLHHYGGIFLDMDLHCRRSLGPLRRFEFVAPAAYPIGISNGFLMVSARHPFIEILVKQLPLFNRNFVLPYATVMFSTGCMYLSAQYSLYNDRCRLRLLDYQHHRLSGHVTTPLFHHHGSGSWHADDASFIKKVDASLNFLSRHQISFWLIALILISLICMGHFRNRTTYEEEKKKTYSF